jgi:hypothetical protein
VGACVSLPAESCPYALQLAATNPKFASKVSYSLTYDVRINSTSPPAAVISPSHNDVLQSSTDGDATCITASKEGALMCQMSRQRLLSAIGSWAADMPE